MRQHQRAGDKGASVLLTVMSGPRWCSKSSHKGVTKKGAMCAETSHTHCEESLTDRGFMSLGSPI